MVSECSVADSQQKHYGVQKDIVDQTCSLQGGWKQNSSTVTERKGLGLRYSTQSHTSTAHLYMPRDVLY